MALYCIFSGMVVWNRVTYLISSSSKPSSFKDIPSDGLLHQQTIYNPESLKMIVGGGGANICCWFLCQCVKRSKRQMKTEKIKVRFKKNTTQIVFKKFNLLHELHFFLNWCTLFVNSTGYCKTQISLSQKPERLSVCKQDMELQYMSPDEKERRNYYRCREELYRWHTTLNSIVIYTNIPYLLSAL